MLTTTIVNIPTLDSTFAVEYLLKIGRKRIDGELKTFERNTFIELCKKHNMLRSVYSEGCLFLQFYTKNDLQEAQQTVLSFLGRLLFFLCYFFILILILIFVLFCIFI